jgi:7-cyano-7-deazaguanine synthase
MKQICVLASGGVDSSSLIAYYRDRGFIVHPLYVRFGFIWEKAELYWLRRQLKFFKSRNIRQLQVLDVSGLSHLANHWGKTRKNIPGNNSAWDSVFLPGQNYLLLACAASYCRNINVHRIAIGTLRNNPFDDASPSYRNQVSQLASLSFEIKFKIEAPFYKWKKMKVIRRWPELLARSFSCYNPIGYKPCGACAKCGELNHKDKN